MALLLVARAAWKHRDRLRPSRAAWSSRARDAAPATEPNPVRAGGPEAMRDPPRRWDGTDEALDQTFPASDPSARY
jgi:hypothetical protein